MPNDMSRPTIRRRDLSWRRAKHQKTWQQKNGATEMINPAMPMHSAVIGTSGMIATGGTIIVTRSFSSASDTIFWTEATGIRTMATILSTAITITMGRSILTVIYYPTR